MPSSVVDPLNLVEEIGFVKRLYVFYELHNIVLLGMRVDIELRAAVGADNMTRFCFIRPPLSSFGASVGPLVPIILDECPLEHLRALSAIRTQDNKALNLFDS